jgi:hypothetical protein
MSVTGRKDPACDRPSPHGWTLDTLEEFLTSKITALASYTTAESRASKEAVSAALAAVKEQSQAAMTAAEKAINKAENATEKRFDSVNEFRQTLSDQATNFLGRNEYAANHKSLEEKIAAIDKRITSDEASLKGRTAGVGSVGVIVLGAFVILSAFGSIASAIFAFMSKH